MKTKRRLRKSLRLPLLITAAVLMVGIVGGLLYLFVFNNIHFLGIKSVNENAKTYKTKSCLAFYPDTKDGKKVVLDLCSTVKKDEEAIFDYALIEYGDYYLVEYGSNVHYYIDHNNNPLVIQGIKDEGKQIVVDYLRYEMRKAEVDEAYTTAFIKKTNVDNLDISNAIYAINGKDLDITLPEYEITLHIPLKYIQEAAGINLGYQNELYQKPTYISNKRKMVAFTFDDGPNMNTTPQIVDALKEYDSNATFFVLGSNLNNQTVSLIKESIENGNQYGSHSQTHTDYRWISAEEAVEEILSPANDLKNGYHAGTQYDFDGLGYEVTVYRPPYGGHTKELDAIAPYIGVTWDCDTLDWKSRDKDAIIAEVRRFESKNPDTLDTCIVLMHDIYQTTVDAFVELLPELIDEGYQIVTVDEVLKALNITKEVKACYPW